MRIFDNLEVAGSIVISDSSVDFPSDASIGTLVVKNECLYAYLNIGNLKTWYPLGVKTQSYVHMQAVPSLVWTINHELKTRDIWYQVKNSDGNIIHPAHTDVVDENTLRITFSYAISGTAVVVGSSMLDVPTIKTTGIKVGDNVDIGGDYIKVNDSFVLTKASLSFHIKDDNSKISINENNEFVIKGDADLIGVKSDQGEIKVFATDHLKTLIETNRLQINEISSILSSIEDGGTY